MRVAHCIHGLDLGGAQQVVKEIVRGARDDLGYLVYAPVGGVFQEEVAQAGATVRIIPRTLPKLDPFWARRLAVAMRHDRVDVVHAHLFGDCLHAFLAARWAGRLPVVITLHNVAPFHTPLQQSAYRWLMPRVERVVGCSDAVARSFQALAPAGVTVETVPNGVAASTTPIDGRRARASLGQPVGPLVGALGRLVDQKGFEYLIAALARLARSGTAARCALLGEGPQRAALEAQAHLAGLADSVSFPGFRADARDILAAFDVVVFSSVDEGLPIALLEAMDAGRCIVATDVGGVGDAVRDGREALLIPARDADALAIALGRVLADDGLRERLGAAARRRFRERFTADRMVTSYERLYRELHAQRTGGVLAPVSAARAGA